MKTKIQTLEDDINSLKSSHHVEYQKIELLMSNLQSELTKESKNLQEEVHKNEKLKQELNIDKNWLHELREDILNIEENLRREKVKCNDEGRQRKIIEESLNEEKEKLLICQSRLREENKKNKDNIVLSEKIRDLESEISHLTKQV